MSPEDPNYILWILELISASMSLLGSFFNMMMFIIFKDLRNEATELIFCLSISSFFTNFSYLIINPIHINDYKDEKICKIQGFSIIIFEISQSLWATLISYSAFRNTVFQNYEYTCIRRTCYLLIGFGFPFLISLTILLFNGIGKNERWCWINQEKFWLQTAIYIFMWLLIFISFYYIRIVILYLKRIFSDRNERELVNKFTLRIKFIPIIQACCMIPATIAKILHKFYNSQPLINVFDFPIPIFINIQGFFYSLVFGFHPQVKEHLASFYQKFRCCKDKEDSNTDSLSSSSKNKQVDYETEQEAITVIKNQNKKIKHLTNELERRDDEIAILKNKLSGVENNKSQIESFKRQIVVLDDKLREYEENSCKTSNYYKDQFRQLADSENKLRTQLINKDKTIKDYDMIIKDQDKGITELKKQVIEKEALTNELKQEFNEISSRFKNLNLKLKQREEEYKKICADYEERVCNVEEEKNRTNEKINELIDIVKQQSKELSDFYVQCQLYEKEKKNLLRNLESLQKDYENCCSSNNELKSQFSVFSDFRKKINEAEISMKKINSDLQVEHEKNMKLIEEKDNLINEIERFKSRLSGENSPDYLKQIILSKDNEIMNLNHSIDHAKKSSMLHDNKIKDLENEIKEIIMGINVELKTINQWIDTYLGVYFDKNIEIPELPYTISKSIKNKIKFESLKENLIKSRQKMNIELCRSESFIRELKAECSDYILNQEKLISDTTTLKNEILSKNEDIFILQQKNDSLNKEFFYYKEIIKNNKVEINDNSERFCKFLEIINSKLISKFDNLKQNNLIINNFPTLFYKNNFTENIKDQISESLQNLFEVLDKFINDYDDILRQLEEHKVLKQEMEKFRKENSLKFDRNNNQDDSKNEDILNKIINERNEQISNLNNEISLMKNNVENNQNRVDIENNEKVKILEKKIVNLNKEVELKEMQIKNQEEMIIRRNTEIDNLKGKPSSKNEEALILASPNIVKQDLIKNMVNYNYNIHDKSKNSTMNNSRDN